MYESKCMLSIENLKFSYLRVLFEDASNKKDLYEATDYHERGGERAPHHDPIQNALNQIDIVGDEVLVHTLNALDGVEALLK